MDITYTDSANSIQADQLRGGFFVGWPNPPSPEAHLRALRGSFAVELALDGDQVVGYITAISDGVSAAFIPHLEVLPAYKGKGIGTELVKRIVDRLSHLYVIDLICDEDVVPFYDRLGFRRYGGMVKRNYAHQNWE
jgi:GNAT superfamily N-acetyltransferase